MLRDNATMATIAVRSLATARPFYEGKLGLQPEEAGPGGTVVYRSGGSMFLVHESQFAGTNRATAATWTVGDDVEDIVGDLKAKGIAFEHYDLPGLKQKGDVHVADGMKAAWFKDPDGNILALVSG